MDLNINVNNENELLNQVLRVFDDYKEAVNDYTLKTLEEYSCNIAEYISDTCRFVFREKYTALQELANNEKVVKVATTFDRMDYEEAHKYLQRFIGQHDVIQSITIRNNVKQKLLSVAKDRTNRLPDSEEKIPGALIFSNTNRQVVDTGNIAVYHFELREWNIKVGTMTVGISIKMFQDAVERAAMRVPSFFAMYLINNSGTILYPAATQNKELQLLYKEAKRKCIDRGFFITGKTPITACGYARITELPFPTINPLTIACELQITTETKTH